jgi:SAM-dependent methyltransferase
VIGVDCNREMLALARRHAPAVAERLGFDSVDFRYGMIQDLTLDLARLETVLADRPVASSSDYLQLRNIEEHLRHDHPLIASSSIDCVISNCVLNLVRQQDRQQLFAEVFRVLRSGGRAAISDIVADENVPDEMRQDPQLWSGCVSGAFREDEFLTAFEDAGFHGIEIVKRAQQPWQTIQGIEFRSVTVLAYKGKQGPCFERNQAVVYRGPFRSVEDDDGHVYRRGERIAVCDKTFQLLAREPYTGAFEAIEPHVDVPPADAQRFDCTRSRLRDARETKGQDYRFTSVNPAACCGGDQGCC